MRYFLYSLIILLTLSACKNDKSEGNNFAFFGGEIINPNNDYVVLLKGEKVIDTLKLDNNNRFSYTINNLHAGFYTFKHGIEVQVVLIEPKDSIMLRLNTLDFDESLVFSGDGSDKNNYLINEYLQNEILEKEIFKLCKLDPLEFETEISNLKEKKNKNLDKFVDNHETSDLFIKIAQSNIKYNYYSNKEAYPVINYTYNKQNIFKDLPEDFYNYRKEVDYNEEDYLDYLNYNSFLRFTLNNLTLASHLSHSESNDYVNTSVCYNLDKLRLIDSLVINNTIKNNLLYYYTILFLTKNKHIEKNESVKNEYLKHSTDEKNNEKINDLFVSINNLTPGETFPSIKIKNTKNSELEFYTVINKPTAVYFWSRNYFKHFKESHYKVHELKSKYPEVDFIAINIDDFSTNTFVNTLQTNNFSLENEYQFKNPEEAMHTLAIYPMNKVIIIDKNNIIVNSKANLFSRHFEEQLLGLINK
jgi:hypothetical protein